MRYPDPACFLGILHAAAPDFLLLPPHSSMLPTSNAMYPGHGQRQPSRGPEPYSSNQFNPGDSSLSRPNHGLPRRDEFFSAGMGGQQDGPVIQTVISPIVTRLDKNLLESCSLRLDPFSTQTLCIRVHRRWGQYHCIPTKLQ
jgi:hypothetical protein